MIEVIENEVAGLEYQDAVTLAFSLIEDGHSVEMVVDRTAYSCKRNYTVKSVSYKESDIKEGCDSIGPE